MPDVDPITAWLNRTAKTARTLADQWHDLADFVVPGGGGGDESGIRTRSVHAAAPIRLEVVSLRDDIAAMAGRYQSLVRGTLRMGVVHDTGTVRSRLGFIAGALMRLHAEDEVVCEEVADAIWHAHRKASRVIDPRRGTRPRPFRIDEPCPDCGEASLWVDPSRWLVACGMPACGGVWAPDAPILATREMNLTSNEGVATHPAVDAR